MATGPARARRVILRSPVTSARQRGLPAAAHRLQPCSGARGDTFYENSSTILTIRPSFLNEVVQKRVGKPRGGERLGDIGGRSCILIFLHWS
jgi:hypothetical protein